MTLLRSCIDEQRSTQLNRVVLLYCYYCGTVRNRDVVNINIEDLEQHFRNLNCTVMDDDPIVENEPGINNSEFDDTILNEPITEDEILKASTRLKNNKSPGADNITSIKASMPL